MSQSATRATQNDMTTCLETFEKGRFCSFPHRDGINDPTRHSRRIKGPAPRPSDYKREPFATQKGVLPPAADPSTVKGTSHWWYPSKWYACTLKPVGRRLRFLPQTNTFGHCKACYVYMYLYVHLWCSIVFVMQRSAMQYNEME